MASNRKLISWRIDSLDLREQEIINEWLDNQQNIQKSITNVVQHMIDRFGTTDIMNFENQRALYTEDMPFTFNKVTSNDNPIVEDKQTKEETSAEKEVDVQNKEEDSIDLYEGLNSNNKI